ncbi:hypothetical protein MKEN_00839800 [Mycena kentingensis (nom. inval.)]|nr:hypothetical protein MKEN_00839800 [Mycena kentingensis (nom. inval.)]
MYNTLAKHIYLFSLQHFLNYIHECALFCPQPSSNINDLRVRSLLVDPANNALLPYLPDVTVVGTNMLQPGILILKPESYEQDQLLAEFPFAESFTKTVKRYRFVYKRVGGTMGFLAHPVFLLDDFVLADLPTFTRGEMAPRGGDFKIEGRRFACPAPRCGANFGSLGSLIGHFETRPAHRGEGI